MMPPHHLAPPHGSAGFGPSPQMGLVPGLSMPPQHLMVGADAPPPHFISVGGGAAAMVPMPQGMQAVPGVQAMGMQGMQGMQGVPMQGMQGMQEIAPAMVLGPMGPMGPMVGMPMQGEAPHETNLLREAFEFARVFQAAPPDPEQRELAALKCSDIVSLMLGRLLVATARYKTMLCNNYAEADDGSVISQCSYEDKCMFAHGPRDMRRNPLMQGYEPLLCPNVPRGYRTVEPWCRYYPVSTPIVRAPRHTWRALCSYSPSVHPHTLTAPAASPARRHHLPPPPAATTCTLETGGYPHASLTRLSQARPQPSTPTVHPPHYSGTLTLPRS